MTTNIEKKSEPFVTDHCVDNSLSIEESLQAFQKLFPVYRDFRFINQTLIYENIINLERALEYLSKAQSIITEYHLPLRATGWRMKEFEEAKNFSLTISHK